MSDVRVEDVMTRFPITVVLGTTVGRAAALIAASEVGQLMVLDGDGRLAGVLSEGDLLRALLPDAAELAAAGGSVAAGLEVFGTKAAAAVDRPVDDLVVRDPVTIAPEAPVAAAAVVMDGHGVRRLPVVADGRLVGTVSRIDLCRAVLAPRRPVSAHSAPAPAPVGRRAPAVEPTAPSPALPSTAAARLAAARERIAAVQRSRPDAPGPNGVRGG